jgi:hypothetical protein
MPRGYPDDNIQASPLGQTIADNAELAARLGAKTTIQRSGNVIYSTDWSNGASDWLIAPAGFATGLVVANNGIISPCSLELYPGDMSGNFIDVHKRFPTIDLHNAAWEFYIDFRSTLPPSVPTVTFIIDIVHNLTRYFYVFDFLPATQQIDIHYWDATHVLFHAIITLPFALFGSVTNSYWHFVKVTVSPITGTYKSLLIDDQAYDLSAYTPDISPYVNAGYTRLAINYTDALSNAIVYLGSTVLTINEP